MSVATKQGTLEIRGLEVAVDGKPVRVRRRHMRSGSELLSAELDVFGRDAVYEAAARAAARAPTRRA
jgi:hypothetical protein